jgi:hypothetical protein
MQLLAGMTVAAISRRANGFKPQPPDRQAS